MSMIQTITWQCLNCPDKPTLEHQAMMEHMKTVHKFDPKTTFGTQLPQAFMDGKNFHRQVFKVKMTLETGNLEFIKTITFQQKR